VSLDDYSSDVSGASIRWRVGGVERPELANIRSIEVTTGEPDIAIKVEALLTLPSGESVLAATTITPRYFDLLIEPQTRVPFHYTGRALPSTGSTVNATALLSGKAANKNLLYTWRLNNVVLMGGPLMGQQQISFTMPQGSGVLEVTVEDPTTGILASRSIELLNANPFLHFYPISTLYGMSSRPITEVYTLIGASATVLAEPYYLDLRTYNNPDLAEWTLEGGYTGTRGTNPYELTLVRGFGGKGGVGFHVRNLTDVLKGAQSGFTVQ
jgi:hypothetical protein